jgi:hypothetical protein
MQVALWAENKKAIDKYLANKRRENPYLPMSHTAVVNILLLEELPNLLKKLNGQKTLK